MDYGDIVDIITGAKMTKQAFEKYRKQEPSRKIVFYSIKEKDMTAAFRHCFEYY